MANPRKHAEAVRIPESDQNFLLHPEDNDLFMRTGRQVIAACRLGIGVDLWMKEARGVIQRARDWSKEHKDLVRSCFFSPESSNLTIFFVPTADQFDFDLADRLAELNSEVVRDFNVGLVELHQIPWDERFRFVSRETGRTVYGEPIEAPRSVEARP